MREKFMKKTIFNCIALLVFVSCSNYVTDYFFIQGNAVSLENSAKKWTIMIYMASDNELEGDAIHDINELELFDFDANNITVLTLFDRAAGHDETNGNWDDSRLFEISKDAEGENAVIISKELSSMELGLEVGSKTELDMSRGTTLENFLKYGYNHYRADHYALIIWGHGNGWRSVTTDNQTHSTMPITEFQSAIELGVGENTLDVIALDASFGSTIELLWEVKDSATWFVGTPKSMNFIGWNYKDIFSHFLNTTFSINEFLFSFGLQNESVVVDLQKMQEVKDSFDSFSSLVAQYVDSREKQSNIFELLLYEVTSYRASTYPTDVFLDIFDYAEGISKNASLLSSDSLIQKKIMDSSAVLQQAVINALPFGDANTTSLSVFFISFLKESVPDSMYPQSYIQNNITENKIQFVNESSGWVPTTNESATLLNKLFFTVF